MSIYEAIVEPDNLRIISMAEVEPQTVEFLVAPFLPRGKITLLQGDPGGGKTWVCLRLTAHISNGHPLLDEESGRTPGRILYQTAEDGIADTIYLRLEKMGANMKNVYFIDEN